MHWSQKAKETTSAGTSPDRTGGGCGDFNRDKYDGEGFEEDLNSGIHGAAWEVPAKAPKARWAKFGNWSALNSYCDSEGGY